MSATPGITSRSFDPATVEVLLPNADGNLLPSEAGPAQMLGSTTHEGVS
jgi:hypothetical protein